MEATFVISDGRDGGFTQAIYEAREFTKHANVSVLHCFSDFYQYIFEPANENFKFRLLIHLGLGDSGLSSKIGEKILEDFRGKLEFKNIDIHFITRNASIFGDKYFVEIDQGDITKNKYWYANRINRDEAITDFLEKNTVYRKADLVKNILSQEEAQAQEKQLVIKEKPQIFIGSSSNREALMVAMAIKKNLNKVATCDIWNEDVFKVGETTLDTLERIIHEYDYSIFVFRGDDTLFERNGKAVPRDNVILEYGMFLGKNTRKKTFFVIPKDIDIHIATDLLGLTNPIPYNLEELERNPTSAMSVSCNQIIEIIKETEGIK